ncbi:MAG: hypothetical protein LBR53_11695 [Deltaproteobacteria bacterium]|jgi:hypothetical protein|nr:hypothetical protein [Deltaproteobacteria bacterium]
MNLPSYRHPNSLSNRATYRIDGKSNEPNYRTVTSIAPYAAIQQYNNRVVQNQVIEEKKEEKEKKRRRMRKKARRRSSGGSGTPLIPDPFFQRFENSLFLNITPAVKS